MPGPKGPVEQRMCGDRLRSVLCLASGVADRNIITGIEEAGLKSADGLRRPIVAAAISVALASLSCVCKGSFSP